MEVKQVQAQVGSRTVTMQTGKLAKQADGAVVIACGETVCLVSAVAGGIRDGIDFFPLTVDIEERHYAAGRIPGSFFRSEGRPSDNAILAARLVDRPLRPCFPDWFKHDTQIISMVMQVDGEQQYDVLGITGASAACLLGGIPIGAPIAGVRLAHIRGRWVVMPTYEELEQATIELVVSGRIVGDDVEVGMIEAGGFGHTFRLIAEGATPPNEDVLCEGLEAAKEPLRALCRMQEELVAMSEIPSRSFTRIEDYTDDVMAFVAERVESDMRQALDITAKLRRQEAVDAIRDKLLTDLPDHLVERDGEVKEAFRSLEKKLVRKRVVTEQRRVDGRGVEDLRPLHAETGLLPRVHGTGLFQRGESQALAVTALGMPRMEQMLDTLAPEDSKRYMHSYKMMPFSTGETGRLGANRRATGHGALAEKAVFPAVPGEEEFPYAIRVVSEILESNGSTSMASTCASTLALLDAGVPMRDYIGGIAMGLMHEGDQWVVLTDIMGVEDFFGDMDFKVAGPEGFITAIQLDTKLATIPTSVLARAIHQSRPARLKIIETMKAAIPAPNQLSKYAPRIVVETIPVDKIGELIGPKGKTINDIVARTGVQIDVEDDGRVFVAGEDSESVDRALTIVRQIAKPPQLEVGQEFEGTVVKTTDFGAFVQLMPGKDGLVHISKLGRGKRIKRVEDVVSQGDTMHVRIQEIRPDGKLSLVPIDEASDEDGSDDGGSGQGFPAEEPAPTAGD